MDLVEQKCVACEGGMAPFTGKEAGALLGQIPGWLLSEDAKSIAKEYVLDDFRAALAFINEVGEIAETEGHHPDMHLTGYRNVLVRLSTHAIGGLSQNDFILAAKIDGGREKG